MLLSFSGGLPLTNDKETTMHDLLGRSRRYLIIVLLAAGAAATGLSASASTTIDSGSAVRTELAQLGRELQNTRAQETDQVANDLSMWRAYRELAAAGKSSQAKAILTRVNAGPIRYLALAQKEAALQAQIQVLNNIVFAPADPPHVRSACKSL
jgi:hypothetical protein